MSKYLLIVSYNAEGIRGIQKEGGSARRKVAENVAAELGGTVESFHFAFGGADAYVVIDLPDNTAAAALGLALGASGAVTAETVVLLTPEEVDKATGVTVDYRAPGQ